MAIIAFGAILILIALFFYSSRRATISSKTTAKHEKQVMEQVEDPLDISSSTLSSPTHHNLIDMPTSQHAVVIVQQPVTIKTSSSSSSPRVANVTVSPRKSSLAASQRPRASQASSETSQHSFEDDNAGGDE
ncbi:hypothetical protein HDU98_008113 [Podochytrium sp. JEL0797]|nr:hypothetical protein HDU98_008113 [Podochytrium sp. JEL0797]